MKNSIKIELHDAKQVAFLINRVERDLQMLSHLRIVLDDIKELKTLLEVESEVKE